MSGLLSNKNKRFLKKRLKFWWQCLTHPILNEHLIVFEAANDAGEIFELSMKN